MTERPLKLVMVREEFVALTGDFYQALVLNQFNFYQLAARGIDEFIEQENARSKLHDITDGYVQPRDGWFYKSAEELCTELMCPFKRSKAQELIQKLIYRGWVMARDNPDKKWDKVKQYRLDLVKLFRDMEDLGYTLPLWNSRHLSTRKSISVKKLYITARRESATTKREAIPEGTSEGTSENLHPKSLAGARDLDSSSLPDSRDPRFPKKPGTNLPDWTEAVKTLDPVVSAEFMKIFEKQNYPGPDRDEGLAKKYWKARRGPLTASAVRLLAGVYWEARSETVESAEWRKRHPFKQLDRGPLSQALAVCRSYVHELIRDQQEFMGRRRSPEMVRSSLGQANLWTEEEWQERGSTCDSPAAFAVVGSSKRFSTAEFLEKHRDRIARELGDNPSWLEIAREHKFPIQACFGFTEEEILELQRQDEQRYLSEIERLRAFL